MMIHEELAKSPVTKLAFQLVSLRDNSLVVAFDIRNEPHDIPGT